MYGTYFLLVACGSVEARGVRGETINGQLSCRLVSWRLLTSDAHGRIRQLNIFLPYRTTSHE
jgi:hypothetical protein